MHMSYRDYQGFKHGSAEEARRKHEKQRKVFENADQVLAVGPLLRNRASEMADDVRMLIPGMPAIPRARPPIDRIAAISFGRLDPANDRIKQVSLAVGGFAEACGKARSTAGGAPLLRSNAASLTLLGVSSVAEERRLAKLAEERAGRRDGQWWSGRHSGHGFSRTDTTRSGADDDGEHRHRGQQPFSLMNDSHGPAPRTCPRIHRWHRGRYRHVTGAT